MSVAQNLQDILSRVEASAKKSGRSVSDISIVGVTKSLSVEKALEALSAGVKVLAENRIQEAQDKVPAVSGAEWHLIGHLQTNKIKAALDLFSCIQSVDSVRLAQKLHEELEARNGQLRIFLEVNISGEEQKHGFLPEELYSAVDQIKEFSRLKVEGLMGIAPNSPNESLRRASFKKLKGLFTVLKSMKSDNFEMKTLSMGMSDDFEAAVEEGSNMIRLGRALFGKRGDQ